MKTIYLLTICLLFLSNAQASIDSIKYANKSHENLIRVERQQLIDDLTSSNILSTINADNINIEYSTLKKGIDYITFDSNNSENTVLTEIPEQLNFKNEIFEIKGVRTACTYANKEIMVKSHLVSNIKITSVSDSYTLTDTKNNLDFKYNNQHYYLFDKNDINIATISYIDRTVAKLHIEYKAININKNYSLNNNTPNPFIEESLQSLKPHILISPNPANNEISINLITQNEATATLVLINNQGREMLRVVDNKMLGQGEHLFNTNIAFLPKGIYYIKYSSNQSQSLSKLVIH